MISKQLKQLIDEREQARVAGEQILKSAVRYSRGVGTEIALTALQTFIKKEHDIFDKLEKLQKDLEVEEQKKEVEEQKKEVHEHIVRLRVEETKNENQHSRSRRLH